MARDVCGVEGEAAEWFAVEFRGTRLVRGKACAEDTDEAHLSPGGTHPVLISQHRAQRWQGNAAAMGKMVMG